MRDYESEFQNRVEFIRNLLAESGATGVVYGNSGGKDSALVGILCKAACDNTVGLLLPCTSKRNYGEDRADAETVAAQFHIETRTVDLTPVKEAEMEALKGVTVPNAQALANLAPRLRMLTLYAVAASENRLVAGTGNRSETYVGYFTKWGDGAYDFNPISDLTVTEVYEFLDYLDAPEHIRRKAPSAGLYEGQTDEGQLGVTYRQIDDVILTGTTDDPAAREKIERYHRATAHKRTDPPRYGV